MRTYYKEGFMLLKNNGKGPVFIAPHATTALSPVLRGDVGSELITTRLTKRMGGVGIISMVPRSGKYGIDLFRKPATMNEALEMFNASYDYKKRHKFEKKYAFFARDQEEYLEKITVHNNFWTTPKMLAPEKPLFVLMHSQAMRLKNFPSILDVCSNSGRWFDENLLKEAIDTVNEKIKPQMERKKESMKKYIVSWAELSLKRSVEYRFGKFVFKNLQGSYKKDVQRDIRKAALILGKNPQSLERNMTWDKYVQLLEDCVDKTEFKVTYQSTFKGKVGDYNVRNLMKKTEGRAVMFETSAFLNEMYPKTSVNLVEDILKHITLKQEKNSLWNFFGMGDKNG
jgi:hypothetical protein